MKNYTQHFESKLKIYRQAMSHAEVDAIVIDSGYAGVVFQDDLTYPFKANAYLKEWLPIGENQNAFLLITLDAKPVLFIHRPKDYWHSAPALPDSSVLAHFDMFEFAERAEITVSGRVAHIGERGVESNMYLTLSTARSVQNNPPKLLDFIDYHRATKSAYELDQLRAANRLAVLGHKAAEAAFYAGGSELDIHLAYLQAIAAKDSALPYDSIVALNQNAAVLHHMLLSPQAPKYNLSLLIDAGAQVAGYASDISRSYPALSTGGKTEPQYQQGLELYTSLVQGLEQVQPRLVALATAGTDYTKIHVQAHRFVADLLVELKIVNCGAEQAFESGLTRTFLPHGVGHLLGVQVHDRGGHAASESGDLKLPPSHYPALRCTRILEEDMVFTIEPGVYFIPQLLAACEQQELLNQTVIDHLMPFGGVRIEDNVIAMQGYSENMTRDAFKQMS